MRDRTQAFLWGCWAEWAARAADSVAGNMNALSRVGFFCVYACPQNFQGQVDSPDLKAQSQSSQSCRWNLTGRWKAILTKAWMCGGVHTQTHTQAFNHCCWIWVLTKGVGETTFQWPALWHLTWPSRDVLQSSPSTGRGWITLIHHCWDSSSVDEFLIPCAHLPATPFTHRWFHNFRQEINGVFTKVQQGGVRLCICITQCLHQYTIYSWCQIFGKR